MATKLNSLYSELATEPTPEHTIAWVDQSGQSAGSQTIRPRAGQFTITGWTETGTLSIGSPVVTSMSSTVRPRIGMTVTGTGIPVSTTVIAVDHSAGTITLSADATAAGAQTLTFSGTSTDPVIAFGYNAAAGGSELVEGEGSAVLQIEGHYHRDSDDLPLMEAFYDFYVLNATGHARPFSILYDKLNQQTLDVDLAPGPNRSFNINFEAYAGGSGGVSHKFDEGTYSLNAPPLLATKDTAITINSNSSKTSSLIMTANAESAATAPSFKLVVASAGGGNVHKTATIVMRDNAAGAQKTGVVAFRADDTATLDSVLVSIGSSASYNSALLNVDSTNMPTNVPTIHVKPIASQTRGLIEFDGINNGTGAVEVRTFQIYPKGYIAVRESGNTATDREPSTGANTVSLTLTACPGTGTSTKWFPILDTSGALHWLPGVSDA